jgi:death-on-curing protein
MKEPVGVSKSVVLALQDNLIAVHGGQPGLRDEGLLDSALAQPQQYFTTKDPDLFRLAATYVSTIVRNHPFLDGNKRIAFVTGIIFLERNGKSFNPSEAEAVQAMVDLAARKLTEEEFSIWLKENSD